MIEYMKWRPMLTCSVAAVILCMTNYVWKWAPWIGLILIAVLFLLFLYRKARPGAVFALIMLVPVCLSLLAANAKIARLSRYNETQVTGTFIVTEAPADHGTFASVTVEAQDAAPFPKGEKILLRGDLAGYDMGNVISAKVRLRCFEDDSFRSGRYAKGVYMQGNAKKIVLREPNGDPILSAVRDLRAMIGNRLFSSMGKREAATLSAILLGDKTNLDEETEDRTTKAGVSHIMVVSGLHLAIMAGILLRLTRSVTNAPLARFFVIFITAVFLTVLCGFTKSILRASLCLMIYAVSLLLGREHTPENTLGGAVVLLLTFSPFVIFSISFQLSVLSTLGILVCALPMIRMAEKRPWFQNRFLAGTVSAILITASATCFSLPVVLHSFGGVSVVGIFSNLLLVPVMTPTLMITVLLLAVCLPVPLIAPLTLWTAGVLASYVNFVIGMLGGLPFSYLYTNSFETALSLLLPFLLFFVSVKLQRKNRKPRKFCKKLLTKYAG